MHTRVSCVLLLLHAPQGCTSFGVLKAVTHLTLLYSLLFALFKSRKCPYRTASSILLLSTRIIQHHTVLVPSFLQALVPSVQVLLQITAMFNLGTIQHLKTTDRPLSLLYLSRTADNSPWQHCRRWGQALWYRYLALSYPTMVLFGTALSPSPSHWQLCFRPGQESWPQYFALYRPTIELSRTKSFQWMTYLNELSFILHFIRETAVSGVESLQCLTAANWALSWLQPSWVTDLREIHLVPANKLYFALFVLKSPFSWGSRSASTSWICWLLTLTGITVCCQFLHIYHYLWLAQIAGNIQWPLILSCSNQCCLAPTVVMLHGSVCVTSLWTRHISNIYPKLGRDCAGIVKLRDYPKLGGKWWVFHLYLRQNLAEIVKSRGHVAICSISIWSICCWE